MCESLVLDNMELIHPFDIRTTNIGEKMSSISRDTRMRQKTEAEAAVEARLVRSGDTVVITAGVPLHVAGTTNLIKVARIP